MTVYDDIILADGPVLYLPLDDASGSTAVALRGSNGTYSGSPTLGATGPQVGGLNAAISTDGVDDSVTTASLTMPGTTSAQSIELWFNYNATITSATPSLFTFFKNASPNGAVALGSATSLLTGEVITVYPSDGVNERTGWSGLSIPSGWHHLALTYSGAKNGWIAYLDGEDVTGATWGGTKISNDGGSFGFSGTATYYMATQGAFWDAFDGLAALGVYNYALSAGQVLNHYRASPPAFRSIAEARASELGAVLHLPLDDAGGTVARAAIGSDGTYSGGPTLRVAGPSTYLPHGISTDGANDYVAIPSVAGLGQSSPQTFECWFEAPAEINTTSGPLLAASTVTPFSAIKFGSASGHLTNEVVTVYEDDQTAQRTGWSGFVIPVGWHHIALAYNGTQNGWTCYLDGENVTGSAWGGTKISSSGGSYGLKSGQQWRLASFATTGVYFGFDGLAAFTVCNRALTAAEIRTNYLLGLNLGVGTSRSPVGY